MAQHHRHAQRECELQWYCQQNDLECVGDRIIEVEIVRHAGEIAERERSTGVERQRDSLHQRHHEQYRQE
jgi:hypothetical protein